MKASTGMSTTLVQCSAKPRRIHTFKRMVRRVRVGVKTMTILPYFPCFHQCHSAAAPEWAVLRPLHQRLLREISLQQVREPVQTEWESTQNYQRTISTAQIRIHLLIAFLLYLRASSEMGCSRAKSIVTGNRRRSPMAATSVKYGSQ